MDYCNCCSGDCLLVEVAERLEDAMVRQTAAYYQGQYEEEPLLFPLFQLHSYARMLLCNRTAFLAPGRVLGLERVLEGVPSDLRQRFWLAIQHQKQHQQIVSGSPRKPHSARTTPLMLRPQKGKVGRRWLKILGS